MALAAREAYEEWASSWDEDRGALVDLETEWMQRQLGSVRRGSRVVDAGCGTGRWLQYVLARGAAAAGVDFSPNMLAKAVTKDGVEGHVALADVMALPVRPASADCVICALTIGHVEDLPQAMRELARLLAPGGMLLLTDFHPEAYGRGWRRTYRHKGALREVEHIPHPVAFTLQAAAREGLRLEEMAEPGFGPRQEEFFRQAGKMELFEAVLGLPALLLARWRRP